MKQSIILSGLILIALLLQSCDPYYSIAITNTTDKEVNVYVVRTIKFHPDKQMELKDSEGFEVYKLNPAEEFRVGNALAGIDDELPFSKIKIITERDTILADNPDAIKKLFDKKFFGGLKTPYNISVK